MIKAIIVVTAVVMLAIWCAGSRLNKDLGDLETLINGRMDTVERIINDVHPHHKKVRQHMITK